MDFVQVQIIMGIFLCVCVWQFTLMGLSVLYMFILKNKKKDVVVKIGLLNADCTL